MKKAMIIAAMMTVAAAANAQKNDVGQFSIQPRIGFSATYVTNASDMPFDDEGTTAKGEMNGGGVIGAEAEYQITERVSVAGGANYSMQGCNWKSVNTDGKKYRDPRMELGYINIPLVANVYLVDGLAVKAGVQFGFLVSAKKKYSTIETRTEGSDRREVKTDYNINMMDYCRKFDFSIPVGVSYEFDNNLVIDMRYNIGLTNVFKDSDGIANGKNQVLALTLGYKFKI